MRLNFRREKRKISLLAFDLDGTLLNSSSEISEFTLSRIRAIAGEKVKITVCSGRIPAFQRLYLAQLNLNGPYVACNGALIPRHPDGDDLFARAIADEQVERLYAFFMEKRVHACIQARDKMYFTDGNPRLKVVEKYNRLAQEKGLPGVAIGDLATLFAKKGVVAHKAMVYATEEEKIQEVREFLAEEPGIAYTFSEKGLFDIMPAGVDKSFGVKRIADYYGLPYEEICAFGDYDNDLSLFQVAGTSVAMGNAVPRLKVAASFVTDTNDRDGVGKAIEELAPYFA